MQTYPFRLGTTSYIIPNDILPNARYLANKVRDFDFLNFPRSRTSAGTPWHRP